MSELKRFTAEQARELKRSSIENSIYERMMNNIYTIIKQICRNHNSHSVNLSQCNSSLTEKVIKTLLEDGYKVEFDYMSGIMTVKW